MIETARPTLDLDGSWAFVPDPDGRLEATALPDGEPIAVPGCWEAQRPAPYGIVVAWYRRAFTVPPDGAGRVAVARFGSVLQHGSVWLDGRLAGKHRNGHLPFEIELGVLEPGSRHELAVRVDNPFNALTDYPAFGNDGGRAHPDPRRPRDIGALPHGKQSWYSSTSGLIGSVRIEFAPRLRLRSVVALPDPDRERLAVRWRCAGAADPATARVQLVVRAPDGSELARVEAAATDGSTRVDLPGAERWDVWNPVFHRLEARLVDPHSGSEDDLAVRFGIRSIAVRAGEILLNGRPIVLRGALDQDLWPDGIVGPPDRAALEHQAELAREMGLNLLRCHIKIPDPRYLDVADEAGLLVWCELPSWWTFSTEAGATGRRLLDEMVETLGNHPSIIAWTVINEDWGTTLRHEARDRRWLDETVVWLRDRDPSRLIVDNSACETAYGPNPHVRTDLADFHAYRSMPDGLPRWRALVDEYAGAPDWLWSPFGDARRTGDEALVLSEFGTWGLPAPSLLRDGDGRRPWWWRTGHDFYRPAGVEQRFRRSGLDRVFGSLDELAETTQWLQFEALQVQIEELRRRPSIRGYVITELTDAAWEANGLLDLRRHRKVFHDRLSELNAPHVLLPDLPRRDLLAGERLHVEVAVSSFPDTGTDAPVGPVALEWRLRCGPDEANGQVVASAWPAVGLGQVGTIDLDVPALATAALAELDIRATDSTGRRIARGRWTLAVLAGNVDGAALSGAAVRPSVAVVDPDATWRIAERLGRLGHRLVDPAAADIIVAAELDRELVAFADRGASLLLLARSADSTRRGGWTAPPFEVVRRRGGDGMPPHRKPWEGDWITVFGWLRPGAIPGLPPGVALGAPYADVYPDHVLTGLGPEATVLAGLFAGWVHEPAAVAALVPHGRGSILATTFRVSPTSSPMADALLAGLLEVAAGSQVDLRSGAA